MEYLKFPDIKTFDEWHQQVNDFFGWPNDKGMVGYTYSFTGKDGNIYAAVDKDCPGQFIVSKPLKSAEIDGLMPKTEAEYSANLRLKSDKIGKVK